LLDKVAHHVLNSQLNQHRNQLQPRVLAVQQLELNQRSSFHTKSYSD
jgi:hypothetical protein